jgi:hypothetical protein
MQHLGNLFGVKNFVVFTHNRADLEQCQELFSIFNISFKLHLTYYLTNVLPRLRRYPKNLVAIPFLR